MIKTLWGDTSTNKYTKVLKSDLVKNRKSTTSIRDAFSGLRNNVYNSKDARFTKHFWKRLLISTFQYSLWSAPRTRRLFGNTSFRCGMPTATRSPQPSGSPPLRTNPSHHPLPWWNHHTREIVCILVFLPSEKVLSNLWWKCILTRQIRRIRCISYRPNPGLRICPGWWFVAKLFDIMSLVINVIYSMLLSLLLFKTTVSLLVSMIYH